MEPIWEAASTTRPETPPSRKYQFARDAEDDDMSDIDIEELSGAAKRLDRLARSAPEQVEAQNKLIERIADKAGPRALHLREPCMLLSPTTTASVLTAPRSLDLITRPLPSPSSDEVQVSIKATGLCGSDLHYHSHFSVAGFPVLEPLTLGHESSGIITALGSDVPTTHPDLKAGDHVALEVGVPCSVPTCERCSEVRYNICPSMKFRSSARSVPHFQGTFQERINHPAECCWKLPESVSLEEGALVEPLSVAIHTVRRSGIRDEAGSGCQGMHVKASLVLGVGTIGLMTAAVLRVSGVQTVVVADVNEAKVSFAVENGFADRGVIVERSSEEAQTTDDKMIWARECAKTLGKVCHYGSLDAIGEFDVVFECTGVESCVQTAIYATRPGGKVLLVGIGAAVQTLPIAAAAQRGVDLVGVFRYASTYADGIEMIAATNEGRRWDGAPAGARPLPDLTVLVTHRFRGLTSVKDAFDMASKSIDDEGNLVLKVMVQG